MYDSSAEATQKELRLHLGCGHRYLEGYLNIDLPPAAGRTRIADIDADILDLRYPAGSVEEVRLHHVFEHFARPQACALLASWFAWLKPGGEIRIEVPDFKRTAWHMLNPFASSKKAAVAERHIFGSHEADWAIHREGYTPRSLKRFVKAYGFDVLSTKRNAWKGTHNIELIAEKSCRAYTREDFRSITERYLRDFLVDDSESELPLLETWMEIFHNQMERSWAGADS